MAVYDSGLNGRGVIYDDVMPYDRGSLSLAAVVQPEASIGDVKVWQLPCLVSFGGNVLLKVNSRMSL